MQKSLNKIRKFSVNVQNNSFIDCATLYRSDEMKVLHHRILRLTLVAVNGTRLHNKLREKTNRALSIELKCKQWRGVTTR